MTRYSVQPRDKILYWFLSFAKNISKKIGKNINKNLCGKYSQKLLDHAKKSPAGTLKTSSKQVIQKTAETTGDLIGSKIANKITKLPKNLIAK